MGITPALPRPPSCTWRGSALLHTSKKAIPNATAATMRMFFFIHTSMPFWQPWMEGKRRKGGEGGGGVLSTTQRWGLSVGVLRVGLGISPLHRWCWQWGSHCSWWC